MTEKSLRQAEGELLHWIGQVLRPYGFGPQPMDQTFARPMEFGCWRLHVTIARDGTLAEVTTSVSLRVDAVEDLVNSMDTGLSRKLAKATSTAGAELGNLRDGRPMVWHLSPSVPSENIAIEIGKEFVAIGLPYLQDLSNLDTLLSRLLDSGDRALLTFPLHDVRLKHAVALALVLKRPEVAWQAAESGERFLAQRNDPRLSAFRYFCSRILPATP